MRTTDHAGAISVLSTLVECGLKDVVISPGSRNAPLVMAASALPLEITVALDERAAAHMALGMALRSRRPVAVISTSGTAAINHGPALAEAFFSSIPLISLTADRPERERTRGAGQSVFQQGLFDAHVLQSWEINEEVMSLSEMKAEAQAAWLMACMGPIHINMPFAEPLYAQSEWQVSAPTGGGQGSPGKSDTEVIAADEMPDSLRDFLCVHDPRVFIMVGAQSFSFADPEALKPEEWQELSSRFALFVDAFSGGAHHDAEGSAQRWLAGWDADERWIPQVVLTMGLPPMDKQWRRIVSEWNVPHWHIGQHTRTWDVFGTLQGTWRINPYVALKELSDALPSFVSYAQEWNVRKDQVMRRDQEIAQGDATAWVDANIFQWLSRRLPYESAIHFANSTSVRYAQWNDWGERFVHANRGVAGIDGCLSTAVGDALKHPNQRVILISGDAAWLYDQNGLQVRPVPQNLRVVVINNGGGNIFRWLDGPESTGRLESMFEAPFAVHVKGSAQQLGLDYFCADSWTALEDNFQKWDNNQAPCLLEINTDGARSATFLKEHLQKLGRSMQSVR